MQGGSGWREERVVVAGGGGRGRWWWVGEGGGEGVGAKGGAEGRIRLGKKVGWGRWGRGPMQVERHTPRQRQRERELASICGR